MRVKMFWVREMALDKCVERDALAKNPLKQPARWLQWPCLALRLGLRSMFGHGDRFQLAHSIDPNGVGYFWP